MDWNQIENDVHFQTQQALGSVSEYKNGREDVGRSITQRPFYGMTGDLEDSSRAFAPPRQSKRSSNANPNVDIAPLENYIQDLRNVTMLQGKKVLSIENILSSYSGVFESSTEAQSSLIMRIDGIEQNLRGSNKILLDASKERNVLSIHVKNLAGKVMSLEDSIQLNDRSYATKEAFSQLLDSTVDEIKSVGVAVSQASAKSSQSLSLIEALIQAIHRMRGRLDAYGEDDTDAGSSLNYEFLSSLTGERQREQVVRLLRESLLNSVTSIARDVSNREAESICNSVNGMLKTLNGQLMLSVDEVGKQTKATCNAANNKATLCLAATNRLESQQADIIRSIEDHADRTRDHVAQQLRKAMETIGEVLEDVSSIQRTVKGDLKSFDVELTEQRKTLYLELGLLKEGHGTLKAACAISERAVSGELTALDKRVADLDSEVRSLRAMMKADNQESVVKVTSSDLSKEVITALVTEVILSDTIERRSRDLAEVAEVISTKQLGQVAALGEESENRISVQLQALKKDFDQAMEVMANKLAQKELEAENSKAQTSVDAEQWRDRADKRMVEFQQRSTQQSAESVVLIQQLRVDLEKKSSELAAAVAALAEKNEKAVSSSATAASDAKAIEKEQAESAAAALLVLQREMLKVSGKVGEAQTALAKMNVQSMHLQDAVTSNSTTAKESHVLVADLAVTVEKLEKRHSESAAQVQTAVASRDETHEQFKRLEDRIDAVASSVSTPRKDGDSSTENRVQTVAEQHSKLAAELDSLRLCFQKAEKDQLITMSQTTSNLKKLEVALSGVEDGLDLLHGEVDQQAEQSSLLQKKLLLTEERVCKIESAASRPQSASPSARQYETSPAFQLAGKSSSLLESRAGAAAGARGDAAVAPPYQKQVAAPNSSITTVSAVTAEAQRQNSISYGSSIANSYSSSKQQSAPALPTDASLKGPQSATRIDPKISPKHLNAITRPESDDSVSVDETSFNGSDLALSPMKSYVSEITRSDVPGEKGKGSLQTAKEEKPLGGAGQLPIASKVVNALPKASVFSKSKSNDSDCDELSEGDVFSNREEVMKQIAGQSPLQRWSLPLERTRLADVKPLSTAAVSTNQSSASSSSIDKGRTAADKIELDSEGEDEHDSSSEEDDDDDDCTENSMSASEDRDTYSGRSNSHNSAVRGTLPLSLRRGHSDEAVDLSSSFDTSASSPLRSQRDAPSVSVDISLPVSSPQMSTSPEYLGDKRSSLKPLNPIGRIMGPSTPVLSTPALTSLKTTDGSSLGAVTPSTTSTPLSSIQKTALSPVPVSTATPAAVPVVRSPQPILSGSLLSLGRKSVAAAVPTSSLGAVTQLPLSKPYEAISKSATGSHTNLGPTKSKPKTEEEEDDDGNLDFDASSWDEEDEADESF